MFQDLGWLRQASLLALLEAAFPFELFFLALPDRFIHLLSQPWFPYNLLIK